jgi:hypothetical protein
MAKAMRDRLAEKGIDMPHSEALEIVARQFGLDSWNILCARIDAAAHGATETKADAEPRFEGATPIFRIFDLDKAREYYLGFLGMNVSTGSIGSNPACRSTCRWRAAASSCI